MTHLKFAITVVEFVAKIAAVIIVIGVILYCLENGINRDNEVAAQQQANSAEHKKRWFDSCLTENPEYRCELLWQHMRWQ